MVIKMLVLVAMVRECSTLSFTPNHHILTGTIPGSCTNGDVKLWRPSDGPEYFGLALYCKNNAWTGVCDDSFTCHTARLFCQQLGFPGAWCKCIQ